MKNDDVELIQQVLAGDENAFAELVKKYQKPVHALAWRKIGDFHIAEEITQDTFLKVYQRLHTLKDPSQFSGWLYVIATRRCYAWLRKKRIRTQPLEDAETTMIQRDAYSRHVAEERVKTAVETQREVVKRLLAKLKESERTVMTLHYLGEMTVEEISRFLGVSAGTIKSRLQRARNRLKREETMIREALDHFQLSPNLTDNIMQEVSRLKPTPSVSKPLVPWVIGAASTVLILLMLGIGSQYLAHFQQPYTLDAQTEMTVELVDTPIVLNLEATPDVRRQLGNINALGESDNNGQKPDEILLTAAQAEGEDMSNQKQQWIQARPAKGEPVINLHATPEGDLYVINNVYSVYRLSTDTNTWKHISNSNKLKTEWEGRMPIVKWKKKLYLVPRNELFTSADDGETWDLLYSWKEKPIGHAVELILTETAFYLAFKHSIYRSNDSGKSWKKITDGLTGLDETPHFVRHIKSLVEIQNTLFAATSKGLYRLNGDSWERLKSPVLFEDVTATAASREKLYVVAYRTEDSQDQLSTDQKQRRVWGIYRSSDFGKSWINITPKNAWSLDSSMPPIRLIPVGEKLLAMQRGMVRSIDCGDTWLSPQEYGTAPSMDNLSKYAVAKDNIIYVGGNEGLHYSTDLGVSWHKMNIKQKRGRIYNLIAMKDTHNSQRTPTVVYARVSGDMVLHNEIHKTYDGGNTWELVHIPIPMKDKPYSYFPPDFIQIVNYGDILYAKGIDKPYEEMFIYQVSSDGKTLERIQGMPVLNTERTLNKAGLNGTFAVDKDTFFMEYNFKLFRWKQGDAAWYETGLEETIDLDQDLMRQDLKLAVSGNNVYVGKRDGHLVVSFDKGNNWVDLTPALPFHVNSFNDIVVAGSSVYVATDAGTLSSDDGRHWRTVTDAEGTNLVMERLTADGTILYGVTKGTGFYRLENGIWEQIISEIPDDVTSLAVDGNTLYVGTKNSGMLHFTLEE